MRINRAKGIGILFLCTAMYGLYGIYSRMMATQFEVFSQNWVRNVFVLSLAIIGILITSKKWQSIAKKDIKWITAWIACDVFFVIAIFISFNHIAIGTALFLLYAGATISSYIAGTVFLKEKLTILKVLAITLSLIGLCIIYGGQLQGGSIAYLILGFVTGIVSAGWNIFPKMISHEYPKLQLIALDASGILLVNFFLALVYRQPVPHFGFTIGWLGLVLYGITQFFGDFLLIYGFRHVDVHIGSLIMPFEAIFGALFAFILFHESLPTAILWGGLFILSGVLVPNFAKE